MSYTPKLKRDNQSKEANRLKWQKKQATGTSGTSFNGLTIGVKYRITVNWTGSGDNSVCLLWTLSGATTYNGGGTWASIHGNEDRMSGSASLIFEAATTTLTVSRVADDWGTDSCTLDCFLEELPSQEETSDWI